MPLPLLLLPVLLKRQQRVVSRLAVWLVYRSGAKLQQQQLRLRQQVQLHQDNWKTGLPQQLQRRQDQLARSNSSSVAGNDAMVPNLVVACSFASHMA